MTIKKVDSKSKKRVPGWRWDAERKISYSWKYDVYVNGQRHEKAGFYSEREAEAAVVELHRRTRERKANGTDESAKKITLTAVFDKHAPRVAKRHQRVLATRVFRDFLALLPDGIKIVELKKAHFQIYIDWRSAQTGKITGKPLNFDTINKELYTVSTALKDAPLLFPELENYEKPDIPKAHGKTERRERLVDAEHELARVLDELRAPHRTKSAAASRRRLADELEFRFETGMRRKEVVTLKKTQYFPAQNCLRDVRRWKTNTTTKFFPLSRRAVAVIESRLRENPNSEFIFSRDGRAREGDYRTLKLICRKLEIQYGRYAENGFIPHDLRHNFASEIARVTDIETAKSLTGHTGDEIFTYLHTNERLQREAIQKRERRDSTSEIVRLYKDARRGKITARKFIEKFKTLAG